MTVTVRLACEGPFWGAGSRCQQFIDYPRWTVDGYPDSPGGQSLYFQLPKGWLLVDDETSDSLMFLCPEHARQWRIVHPHSSPPEPPTPPELPTSGPIESTNRLLRWLKSRRTKPEWVPKTCPRCKHPGSMQYDGHIAWCQRCSWAATEYKG